MNRVLIVDDDESSRFLLGQLLEDAGHAVAYAGDGAAALERLRRRDIDVVVTDLAMPGVNGLRLIRELTDGGGVPVVAVSGQNAEQLLLAEDYGAKATLFKPIDREELLRAIAIATEPAADPWKGSRD